MKIVGISDMHGVYEGFTIPEADILCICGDIVPLKYQRDIELSDDWFINDFIPWCCKQPVNNIYLVGGNHDFFLQNRDYVINQYLKGTKIIYLNNQSAEYADDNTGKIYTIFGSPDCHIFGHWAFMYEPNTELKHFRKIPKNCDILLTHDPIYGVCDVPRESFWNNTKHCGNKELHQVILEKDLKGISLCGHIHTGDKGLIKFNNLICYNVSLLNEQYKLAFDPTIINL